MSFIKIQDHTFHKYKSFNFIQYLGLEILELEKRRSKNKSEERISLFRKTSFISKIKKVLRLAIILSSPSNIQTYKASKRNRRKF